MGDWCVFVHMYKKPIMPPQLKKDFLKLVKSYLDGSASPEEIEALENYYAQFSTDSDITDNLTENEIDALKTNLRQKIDHKISRAERQVIPFYRKSAYRVAASILVLLTVGLFVARQMKKEPGTGAIAQKRDLVPGGNKAMLTLANGSKVDLTNTQNGAIAKQPGSSVTKQNGLLSYKAAAGSDSAVTVSYNTLTTPKGGQYQLTLVDGTKVWLNAASSLKFPTVFTGSERVVELSGEAYFEVVHNAKQPFKVKTARQVIQDVGTEFNVNAYNDEQVAATTLVQGKVKIYAGGSQTMINPGQQYSNSATGAEVKSDVDIDEVTAWKNGMFQFDNADIKTIMRQVGRWYNVDVEYQGQITPATYHGRIARSSNASAVLKILELSGINFTIERGKIIVK